MFENGKKIKAILNHRMASDTEYIGLAQNGFLSLFRLSGMCIIFKVDTP